MARFRKDPDYVPPGLNASLVRQGAWCKLHRQGYAANRLVDGCPMANDCPRCVEDRKWLQRAAKALEGTPARNDAKALVAHAEKLAGHPLMRYANVRA